MQAQAKSKLKKTPIGEIPEDWEVVRLIDHVNTKDSLLALSFLMKNGKGLPLIRIRNLGRKNATEAHYSRPYDLEYFGESK